VGKVEKGGSGGGAVCCRKSGVAYAAPIKMNPRETRRVATQWLDGVMGAGVSSAGQRPGRGNVDSLEASGVRRRGRGELGMVPTSLLMVNVAALMILGSGADVIFCSDPSVARRNDSAARHTRRQHHKTSQDERVRVREGEGGEVVVRERNESRSSRTSVSQCYVPHTITGVVWKAVQGTHQHIPYGSGWFLEAAILP
jgi:hypothetical protein